MPNRFLIRSVIVPITNTSITAHRKLIERIVRNVYTKTAKPLVGAKQPACRFEVQARNQQKRSTDQEPGSVVQTKVTPHDYPPLR